MKVDLMQSKWYLYLTEFFSGMAVMAVELGASRLLAPYFSSSQIVWTIIIGTIMIAMALGNLFGGKWADKDETPTKLFRRILIAAVWIAAIPLVGKYIIVGITGLLVVTISTNLLIWASFLACMILFVFPLFLLGTVTPSLVRFTVSNVKETGSIAGRLGACNTVGSIIGTFLPTFVTIPTVGTAVTFLLFAGILLIIGILYFIFTDTRKTSAAIALVLFTVCGLFGNNDSFAFWRDDLTYEGESVYNYLQVRDTEEETILSTNVAMIVQSIKPKNATLTGMYYDYALAAPAMVEKDDPSILILGMGTGTYAEQCMTYYPDATSKGVEIDEAITDLAHTYFDLPEEIPVETFDGRAYLNADDQKYDVIMVDAYQDITIPFQMSTQEFFTLVRDHLNPGGVMVVNMSMHTTEGEDSSTYISDTISTVFPDVRVVDVPHNSNRELFATMDESIMDTFVSEKTREGDEELNTLLDDVKAGLTRWNGGDHIFTDDKAPVELIGMRTLDDILGQMTVFYKQVLEEQGLSGVLDRI